MSDMSILEHITALVDEERQLRADAQDPGQKAARLKHVAEQLDQCCDLLRPLRGIYRTLHSSESRSECKFDCLLRRRAPSRVALVLEGRLAERCARVRDGLFSFSLTHPA